LAVFLIVLPLWVSLLLLFKATKGAMAMLLQIAKLLPQTIVHEKIVMRAAIKTSRHES
jgi:hypothetical protein